MEGLAMLRQLIGQFEARLEVFGLLHHHDHLGAPHEPHQHHHHHHDCIFLHQHPHAHVFIRQKPCNSWCLLNPDDGPAEDSCGNLMITTRKSQTFKVPEPYHLVPAKKKRRRQDRNPIKVSSETMDEQIWKEFPEDLLEAVIARLPVAMLFQFRSVSRKWNSLCTQVKTQTPEPWFYTVYHGNVNMGAMYDPSLKRWHHRPVPSSTGMIVLPVASAGGLVCFIDVVNSYFYVGNPLTGSFEELQPRSVGPWSPVAVGMAFNGSGYKILWVKSDGRYEVYDSLKKSWVCLEGMPKLKFRSPSACVGRTLYFLRSDPDGIVSYDVETGAWRGFLIPAPPNVTDRALATCRGRVMLVGLVTRNAATCVCVWELQRMTLLWKEVDRMPNVLCLEFYGRHVKMACLGNQDVVMVSLRSGQVSRLVTYNARTGEWQKVPGCVAPARQWIACGTAFYPSLAAGLG